MDSAQACQPPWCQGVTGEGKKFPPPRPRKAFSASSCTSSDSPWRRTPSARAPAVPETAKWNLLGRASRTWARAAEPRPR